MQRLTARLLLLFALAGTFAPLTLAATTAPPHACCLRRAAHRCHGNIESAERAIRGMGCCNHDCCRAARTSLAAHPQPCLIAAFAPNVAAREADSQPSLTPTDLFPTQSTRAPPQLSIA